MKEKWQIIFSGVGGQGLIVCAVALGETAIQYEDKNAAMTTSHGVEMRGTFSKSDIIISTERIDYPEALDPDVIIALAQVAYDRYAETVNDDTIIIYNNETVNGKECNHHLGFPITSLAREAGGLGCENFVSLGLLEGITDIVNRENLLQVVAEKYKGSRFEQMNLKAVMLGMQAAANHESYHF